MHLFSRIARRLAVVLLLLMTLWAALFYYAMVDEIRDEADDSLEHYAALIIARVLAGRELPQMGDGSNNSYMLMPVSEEWAATHPHLEYHDENFYIADKKEEEPARVITAIFADDEGQYYQLRVATPTFEKNDLFESVFIWIVVLYVMLLVIVLGLTMYIFYRNMRPLYDLLHWLDNYRLGSKPQPVPNTSNVTEFRRLGDALQRAIDRSEELYERQAQFIGNASHELQTPLAIIGNRVEWLMDNARLGEQEVGELYKIKQTLSRAVKLNKTLLLLSKIENKQFPESVEVDLVTLVRDCVESFGEIYAQQKIDFRLDLPQSLTLCVNESLLTTLVNNLVKNVYVHSLPKSRASVEIDGCKLVVRNDAEHPLDASHVFDRFYKDSKNVGSTGLGLALVAAICRYYSMGLNYRYDQGQHLFVVELDPIVVK